MRGRNDEQASRRTKRGCCGRGGRREGGWWTARARLNGRMAPISALGVPGPNNWRGQLPASSCSLLLTQIFTLSHFLSYRSDPSLARLRIYNTAGTLRSAFACPHLSLTLSARSRYCPRRAHTPPSTLLTDFADHHGHELPSLPQRCTHLRVLRVQDPSGYHKLNDLASKRSAPEPRVYASH